MPHLAAASIIASSYAPLTTIEQQPHLAMHPNSAARIEVMPFEIQAVPVTTGKPETDFLSKQAAYVVRRSAIRAAGIR